MELGTARLRREVELHPSDPGARHRLGMALHDDGDLKGAIAAYSKAIELDPRYVDAHCSLGSSLLDSGDPKGAERAYRKTIELDPKYTDAYCWLAVVLGRRNDLKEAMRLLDEAIRIAPDNAKVQYNVGVSLELLGETRKAISAYRRATVLDPGYAKAFNNLGAALQRGGDLDGAIDAYRKALSADPQHRNARGNLERALKAKEGRNHSTSAVERPGDRIIRRNPPFDSSKGLKDDAGKTIIGSKSSATGRSDSVIAGEHAEKCAELQLPKLEGATCQVVIYIVINGARHSVYASTGDDPIKDWKSFSAVATDAIAQLINLINLG